MAGEVSFTAMVRYGSRDRLDITIPKRVARALKLRPGDLLVIEIRNIIRKEEIESGEKR